MQFGNQQTIKYSPLINQDSIQGTASENSRGLVKKEIQQAFNEGNLSFRAIYIAEEREYLQQEKKAPRPAYTVTDNIPTKLRIEGENCTIGIINTDTLFSFKRNASTYILEGNNTNLEKCNAKNLPNSKSLLEKQYELASRRWEVYQISTSGHLTADGFFSLPKFKCYISTNYILDHSEEVKSQYTTENIKLFCLSERDSRNIMEILTEKQKLEETLNIKAKLPIGIFSETKGSLTIIFEEDLNLNVLEKNENIIKYCEAIFNGKFRNILAAVIPLSSKIKILSNEALTYFDKSNLKNLREQVILNNRLDYLIKNYKDHKVEELENLIKQGANIHSSIRIPFADKLYQTYIYNIGKCENELHFAKMLECLLINNGDFLNDDIADFMLDGYHLYLERFFNLFIAAYSTLDNVSLKVNISQEKLRYILFSVDKYNPSFPALLDEILRRKSIEDLKKLITHNINQCINNNRGGTKEKYTRSFMILFHYGITPREIRDIKQDIINLNAIIYNNQSADVILNKCIALWDNREQNSTYNGWLEKVQQAQQQIQPIKDRLLAKSNKTTINKNSIDNNKILEDVLSGVFSNKLIFQQEINSNDETIADILNHYYRRPGVNQIRETITNRYDPPEAQIWKPIHSSSHVLRACNNATWYIELLEKFNLAVFTDEEKILLQLAVIYHDVAAEDASKQEEEQKAAYYFKRDLQGKFSSSLLTKVALALETKEDDRHGIEQQHEDIDKYTAIIRFADRMDFIRCSTVNNNFPAFNDNTSNHGYFNISLLNLPQQEQIKFSINNNKKSLFQRNLEASMHGAVDLAEVAGGYHSKSQDLRTKGSYNSRYNLAIDNQRIKFAFEHTDKPVSQLNETIDNNVRRKIAQSAGINTCIDPQHNVCKADTINGISRGIHSTWNDLSQITVPKTMSLLEKMQIEHDFSLLSQATQDLINLEVARLKTEDIQMSLGTLTQNTLKSDAAKATLKKRGITVISEQRARGFNNLKEQVYYEMLVPKSGS